MHACLVRTTDQRPPTGDWSIRSAHQFCVETSSYFDLPIISGPHVTALEGHIYAMAILPQGYVSVHLDKKARVAHLDLYTQRPEVDAMKAWRAKGRAMFGDADGQV